MSRTKVEIRSLGDVDKIPPSFNFMVDWATPAEKKSILESMKLNSRQTMNFRLMPDAKMILLKDLDSNGQIVGWEGLDYQSNPKYPEVFSQFVMPEYRSFLLGVALSHACASFFANLGIEFAYLRMEAATNEELFKIRTESKIYEVVPDELLDVEWRSMCTQCELYKTACRSQSYLRYKVVNWVEFGNNRLGIVQTAELPQKLELKREVFRTNVEDRNRYAAKWAA